jgi:hypothetical protein
MSAELLGTNHFEFGIRTDLSARCQGFGLAWSPELVLIDDGDVVGELPPPCRSQGGRSGFASSLFFKAKSYLGRVDSGGGLGCALGCAGPCLLGCWWATAAR